MDALTHSVSSSLAVAIARAVFQAQIGNPSTEQEKVAAIEKLNRHLKTFEEVEFPPSDVAIYNGVKKFLEDEIVRLTASLKPVDGSWIMPNLSDPEVKLLGFPTPETPEPLPPLNAPGVDYKQIGHTLGEQIGLDVVKNLVNSIIPTLQTRKEKIDYIFSLKNSYEGKKDLSEKMLKEVMDFLRERNNELMEEAVAHDKQCQKAHQLAKEIWGNFALPIEEFRKVVPNADGSIDPWMAGPVDALDARRRFCEDTIAEMVRQRLSHTITFEKQDQMIDWLYQNKNNLIKWKVLDELTVTYDLSEIEKLRLEIKEMFGKKEIFGGKRIDAEHLFRAFKLSSDFFFELVDGRITDHNDIRFLCHCENTNFIDEMIKKYTIQITGDLDYPILTNNSIFLKKFAEHAGLKVIAQEILYDVVETQPAEVAKLWLQKFQPVDRTHRSILQLVISRTEPSDTSLFDFFEKYQFRTFDVRGALLKKKNFLIPKMKARMNPHLAEHVEEMVKMMS